MTRVKFRRMNLQLTLELRLELTARKRRIIPMNWANHQTKKATSDHTQRLRAFLLAILFAVSSPLSMAQANSAPDSEQAGHIIMVTGQVIARDSSGSARQLSRSSSILVGDTILTGPAASTQISLFIT